MLVLLDTTVLTNFALVGLTSIPNDLWGDWTQLKTISLSSEEQLFGVQMFPNLGIGERTCLVMALLCHAMLATDDHLARRAAKLQGIQSGF